MDYLIRSERGVEALQSRGLQHLGCIQQRASAPHHEIRRNGQRNVVIVEITIKLLAVGEVHRIPTVVVIIYRDSRIEVGEIIRGGIDHSFAIALERDIVVPVERQLHRIMRQ